ncbi:hypothetical protein GBA52_026281 [Prunus armeniaca]|nr:hypothetical protein GBA52_026281 [Prunus armeniaca]
MNKHHSTPRRGNHDMSKMDEEQEQVVDRSENNNKIMLKDFDLQGKVGGIGKVGLCSPSEGLGDRNPWKSLCPIHPQVIEDNARMRIPFKTLEKSKP